MPTSGRCTYGGHGGGRQLKKFFSGQIATKLPKELLTKCVTVQRGRQHAGGAAQSPVCRRSWRRRLMVQVPFLLRLALPFRGAHLVDVAARRLSLLSDRTEVPGL